MDDQGIHLQKDAINWIRCPDLHRKKMFAYPHPHWSSGEVGSVSPQTVFFLGIVQNIKICTKTHGHQFTPLIGKRWRSIYK